MNSVLVAASALLAGALLAPGGAQAQRGFRAGGFGGGRAAVARPGLGGSCRRRALRARTARLYGGRLPEHGLCPEAAGCTVPTRTP